jgi:hypothetical protein
MRQRVDAAMDQMADIIKDALLDGLDFADEEDVPAGPPLAPLPPDEFVRRMHERVERTLRQVAEILNDAPDESSAAVEEATGDLFSELWLEALKVAAQMRLDATSAEKPPDPDLPQGEWARRYRRMHADDAE